MQEAHGRRNPSSRAHELREGPGAASQEHRRLPCPWLLLLCPEVPPALHPPHAVLSPALCSVGEGPVPWEGDLGAARRQGTPSQCPRVPTSPAIPGGLSQPKGEGSGWGLGLQREARDRGQTSLEQGCCAGRPWLPSGPQLPPALEASAGPEVGIAEGRPSGLQGRCLGRGLGSSVLPGLIYSSPPSPAAHPPCSCLAPSSVMGAPHNPLQLAGVLLIFQFDELKILLTLLLMSQEGIKNPSDPIKRH